MLLTMVFIEQVEACFEITMKVWKGIVVNNTRVSISEVQHFHEVTLKKTWDTHIRFSFNEQDYTFFFRHTGHVRDLIDPTYMETIVNKVIAEFEIPEDKERAKAFLEQGLEEARRGS